MSLDLVQNLCTHVALRKESVDRNRILRMSLPKLGVALRKESVDRNVRFSGCSCRAYNVALRKESVDRNKAQMGEFLN